MEDNNFDGQAAKASLINSLQNLIDYLSDPVIEMPGPPAVFRWELAAEKIVDTKPGDEFESYVDTGRRDLWIEIELELYSRKAKQASK